MFKCTKYNIAKTTKPDSVQYSFHHPFLARHFTIHLLWFQKCGAFAWCGAIFPGNANWRTKSIWLMGVEACHPRHTTAQRGMLRRFAQDRGLLITGGSDFHGTPGANTPGDRAIGWTSAERDYARFVRKLTEL